MSRACRRIVFLIAALAVPARAEVLTLDAARDRALAQNPGLAEMQARYEALAEVVPQQGALPDPVVSLAAANFPWDEFDRNQEPMTQLQLGVSQTFPFPGKLDLAQEAAGFEAEAALHSVQELQLGLAENVALTWWELYYLDRSLETVENNRTLLRQFVDVARTKYQVGSGLQQDVLLAQLELSKLLEQAIRVGALREGRAIRLNLLMGAAPDTPVTLPGRHSAELKPLAPSSALYERAVENRPALAQQRAAIRASESRLELARRDYYPDFTLGVRYGNRDEDEFGQSRQDFLSVMLSFQVPLYSGSKQDRRVSQRERELAHSQYALADQRNAVFSTIASAAADYRRARAQLELFDQGIIPQARQTVESMLAGYQVNQVDFLNLIRSQVTLLDVELQYWRSYTEANQSIARIRAAVGEDAVHE